MHRVTYCSVNSQVSNRQTQIRSNNIILRDACKYSPRELYRSRYCSTRSTLLNPIRLHVMHHVLAYPYYPFQLTRQDIPLTVRPQGDQNGNVFAAIFLKISTAEK